MRSLLTLPVVAAIAEAATTWTNVRMGGGGGFIPGIVFHPTEPGVAYTRTDIGGIYRLNSDDSWTPITDGLATNEHWGRWGPDALALDPQDADIVYAAVGMYTNDWDPNPGSIIKSTDRGDTWTITELPFKVGGNMPGRGTGERLAVDPQNSDIIYFGARSGNGLWKSTDAGESFQQVESFEGVGTYIPDPSDGNGYYSDIHGLTFVTFDSSSETIDGATSRIFVGTADNITASLYVSEDAGATWDPVADQPDTFFPHKGKLQPEEHALYISYSDGAGPFDGTLGAVWRYDITASSWTDITPVTGSDLFFGFGGLAVDMQNPGTLVVVSLNSWWPDAQIFRSTDSGETWSVLWEWGNYPELIYYYGISAERAPWIRNSFLDNDTKWLGWIIESFEIDPHDSDHFLYGTGLTIYGGFDLTNWDTIHNITIESLADGIEETAVLDVRSAPGGSELLAAVGDISGFTFAEEGDLDTSPQSVWDNPIFTTSVGVDYAGNDPDKVVRVGNGAGQEMIALSSDGGKTWAVHPSVDTDNYEGKVAYSADGDAILWSTGPNGVVRSQDEGPFAAVDSLSSGAVIAADRSDNDYFYAGSSGTFYVSSNSGSTFEEGGSLPDVDSIRYITAHPTTAGCVYISTNAGIFHSNDFGTTFTLVSSSLTNTHQISLGVGSGSTDWNIYAFGTGSNGPKLYGSADGGTSWTDIQGDFQTFGTVDGARLTGSGNVGGRVYVGTNGRGVLYADVVIEGGGGNSTCKR